MIVVGRLLGTFEPARVMVAIAQANSASARANTVAPSHPAGTAAGTNGKGRSQLSASPANTATVHAIGGRILTFAVSVVASVIIGHRLIMLQAHFKKMAAGRANINGSTPPPPTR